MVSGHLEPNMVWFLKKEMEHFLPLGSHGAIHTCYTCFSATSSWVHTASCLAWITSSSSLAKPDTHAMPSSTFSTLWPEGTFQVQMWSFTSPVLQSIMFFHGFPWLWAWRPKCIRGSCIPASFCSTTHLILRAPSITLFLSLENTTIPPTLRHSPTIRVHECLPHPSNAHSSFRPLVPPRFPGQPFPNLLDWVRSWIFPTLMWEVPLLQARVTALSGYWWYGFINVLPHRL